MLRWAIGSLLLAFAIVTLVIGPATAGQRGGHGNGNNVNVVAKWDWSVFDERDKEIERGSFTVRGYVLFKDGRRIGAYDDVSDTQVKVNVTDGRLKGTLDLYKDKASAVNWKGELKNQNGST